MAPGAAVDIEQTRLESLISLVFEDHYHHNCHCQSCTTAREHLSSTDLHFVDHISTTIATGNGVAKNP